MSIRKLLEKVWAYFALAVLVLTAIAVMIVMGAPTVPAIIIGAALFIGLAFVAPDVGLAVFSWIVDEAKKAARNATPELAIAGINTIDTDGLDKRHRRHFGDVDLRRRDARTAATNDPNDGRLVGFSRSRAAEDSTTRDANSTIHRRRHDSIQV